MEYHNYCDFNHKKNSLIIRKINSVSGVVVPGAVFELTSCNSPAIRGTTDSNGLLTFCLCPCSNYSLREISAPAGYIPSSNIYNISTDACGSIFVDGVPTSQLTVTNTPVTGSFTAIKVNIDTNLPLAGAVYSLYMNSAFIASATSNAAGQLTFSNLNPGTYRLVETTPPAGFQTDPTNLSVVVAQNGSVTINGQSAAGFILYNTPLSEMSFRKLNSATGLPLAGAGFRLSQNGTVIGTASSGANGLVRFGVIGTGTYQLTEPTVPSGFQPNPTVYTAIVGINGAVTVNGIPVEEFVVRNTPLAISAPAVINTIFEGNGTVSGTGVPGALISVTLPGGMVLNGTVGVGRTWSVTVPMGVVLTAGQVVSAIQTETGKLPSSRVFSTVMG